VIARCVSLHAERLERDDVWRRTDAFLRRLERRGGRATVFVHPRSAIATGLELRPRIGALLDRGHEVGQHTHFYADEGVTGKSQTDLSPENVRRALDRDHRYLTDAGADPRGFVAGAWAIVDEVTPWLREHGFIYDASVRAFPLSYESGAAARGDGRTVAEIEHGIVRLPTTSPVSRAARGRAPRARVGDTEYELLYFHDYDLRRGRTRLAAAALFLTSRRARWMTAEELAALAAKERATP
jgi:peptidoglycan/xylan/chitin deacetylase (PgdA/CDA1 family)